MFSIFLCGKKYEILINRQTSLSANIVAFCRYLRANDFSVTIAEERDALHAIELLQPYNDPDTLQLCFQTALCRSPQQLVLFPKLYKTYWRELDRAVDSKLKEETEEKLSPTKVNESQRPPSINEIKNWLHGNKKNEETETSSYSTIDVLGKNGFPKFEEKELREIFRLVKKLVEKIANRRSRRFQSTRKQEQIDLKKTIRKSITRGADVTEVFYKKKKKENLKVVLICDVSRSMELYSRFFIQFMYAFQNLFPKVKTFVFSTSLHPVSQELSKKSLDQSLEKIIGKVNNWSGGTKIGASLEQFTQQYAHKHLTSKTLTIILSDGWDTGEIDLIEKNMRLIHRKSLQVLWLNPLAGNSNWKPEVQGMKAALPFVDVLLPFVNLESLRQVLRSSSFGKFKRSERII